MSTPTPAVSIIIPIYNRMEFVGGTLASIVRQTFQDFEVVIIDAGSTEPVPVVVNESIADDPRFRLMISPVQLNSAQARNATLSEVRAPIVAVIDSDDVMVPHRLERQVQVLAERPDIVAVGGSMSAVDEHGLGWRKGGVTDTGVVPDTPNRVHWLMPFRAPTLSSTITVRTDVLRAVGGFDEDHPLCDDYGMTWRLTEVGGFLMLPEIMSTYRIHSKQVSSTTPGRQAMQVALLRRSIMMSRLNRSLDLKLVIAAAGGPSADDETSAAAEALCSELLAWFIEQRRPSEADEQWARRDYDHRIQVIRNVAFTRSEPATTLPPSQ